ncbi:peptidylprolyl isomerase [Luteimicrobium subarcticum]|uniref:peptidylprolyl isomerase n=1 Tax=Luteimicrobium subarcticum TaxID=620910 RepID=A0A2M8W3K1_9MICO|nr:peptidylprolyl isomerase [Luteimicrobium subarcticum]
MTATVALTVVGALALAGCEADRRAAEGTAPNVTQDDVVVSGTAWLPPQLSYAAPLTVTGSRRETVWQGLGPTVHDGDVVVLDTYAEDGRTRKVVSNTWAAAPRPVRVSQRTLGSELRTLVVGKPSGSRYLDVAQSDGVPLVSTVDVLPGRAVGDTVPQDPDVPQVKRADDGTPTVTIPKKAKAGDDLTVLPLIKGSGPQIEAGQLVTVQYTGVVWSTGKTFASTWGDDQLPANVRIGVGDVIEGWDQGLLQVPVGSEVLLVVPPSLGYQDTASKLADQTLVYVVDILDAHDPGIGPEPGSTVSPTPAPTAGGATSKGASAP